MQRRSSWLHAAASVGVSLTSVPASAAEIGTGGELELTISGYVAMNAYSGALDNQREDPDLSTGLDFGTDTEMYLTLEGEDEEAGLEYGGTVEIEADTSDTENAYSTWVFLSGGWGEARLGDEEGPVDESSLGGSTVAAGTGGIDGDIVDAIAVDAVSPTDSGNATKVRYYTPAFGGLQAGVSYTPNDDDGGDTLAGTDVEIVHWVEAAVTYTEEWEAFDLLASVVGSVGENKNEGGKGPIWTGYTGATVTIDDLELGAGFGSEEVSGLEKTYLNGGIGYYGLDPVYASVTFGRVLRTQGYEGVGEPWNLVLSASLDLAEGLTLAGDVAYFDNDLVPEAHELTGGDDGLVWVTRLEVAF